MPLPGGMPMICAVSLSEIAFPYRANRPFGAASFALVFLMIIAEIEILVFVALAIVGHRLDLYVDLQQVVLPGACLVSLSTTGVFWWRARSWTRARIAAIRDWGAGAGSYGERLAARTNRAP